MKNTIIVTGAAGFIGSALVWALNRNGFSDILCVDVLGADAKWKNLNGLKYSDYTEKDGFLSLVEKGGLKKFGTVSAVLHMGANSSTTERDVSSLVANNVEYTKTLCRAALDARARFVYASSGATYGDGSSGYSDDESGIEALRPLNPYGWSKQAFDLWAKKRGYLDRIVGLKYFNVFGPNEYHKGEMRSMVLKWHEQILRTGRAGLFRSYRPEFPDGGQKRDFLYVKDAAAITLFFLEKPSVNGLFNVGTGKAETWNDLAKAVFAAMGRPEAIDYVDMPEGLKNQYQYFTQAEMGKLKAAGHPGTRFGLAEAVKDYVTHYIAPGSLHLDHRS